ncbi:response regulator [Jatrophihabitans sp. DSM 45814]
MTRVLLVDDHQLFASGLRARLELEDGITAIADAETGEDAVRKARANQPDVVLLDLVLPHCSGYDVIPQVLDAAPKTRVLVVSSQTQPSCVRRAITAGASGYVCKRACFAHLVEAIRRVAAGDRYVEPELGARLIVADDVPALSRISDRERDVLHLLALGYTTQEIGAKLYISSRTVDTHRAQIMHKLQFHTRAELVLFALAAGVIGGS